LYGRGTTVYTFPTVVAEHVIVFGYGFQYNDVQTDTWFRELVANDRRY